jgi:hypothetical protein
MLDMETNPPYLNKEKIYFTIHAEMKKPTRACVSDFLHFIHACPLGLEPRISGTRLRRVSIYTKDKSLYCSSFLLAFVLAYIGDHVKTDPSGEPKYSPRDGTRACLVEAKPHEDISQESNSANFFVTHEYAPSQHPSQP